MSTCSIAQSCPTLCNSMNCSPPGSSIHEIFQARTLEWVAISLLLISHAVMSDSLQPHGLQHASFPCPSLSPGVCSNSSPLSWWCHHLILFHPLLLLPSIFPGIRALSSESALHIKWPKYLRFSISPSNEYSGLISFRTDWSDLLAVQGTLKSLLEHHNLKASVLRHSSFFMVQLSHSYMITGKTIALTIWTFVSKVMSLVFNTLSWFVTAFLPRSKQASFNVIVAISYSRGSSWPRVYSIYL